jgi:hypothetical protein
MLRVETYRCECGLQVRAMVSGEAAVPLVDRQQWLRTCTHWKLTSRPLTCPKLLRALSISTASGNR